jgi:hypothetical protein
MEEVRKSQNTPLKTARGEGGGGGFSAFLRGMLPQNAKKGEKVKKVCRNTCIL